ncbi:alpha-amylase [Streptomyces sp. JB150]|uniref:alpha-amylase n=1 Tax=Streptomyces sp. JB150 TaxID=2714844 RepID=UPI00140B255D|nr:alpha-amylase [Streptomyces sp. JB150]QIJ60751.1 alpha-amylase [Streptomyces sp. JB150]
MLTFGRLRKRARAGAAAALALSAVTAGTASASTAASAPSAYAAEPAPSCVTLYQSWRYTQAGNGCGATMTVKVVYQDGAEGLCRTAAPNETVTLGDGYAGPHGQARYIALCDQTLSGTGFAQEPADA